MRIDQHLPAGLPLRSRETFFLSCWFNLCHKGSLDSYRVSVMNPGNILRELLKMFEPHADEGDRRRVAEEAIGILDGQPVLRDQRAGYVGLDELLALLKEAVADKGDGKSKAAHGVSKRGSIIRSFCEQLRHALERSFMGDSLQWLEEQLAKDDAGLQNAQKRSAYDEIEHVCRDMLSMSLDDDGSLETLYAHYRSLIKPNAEEPYDFNARFARMRERLTAPAREQSLVFQITGNAALRQFEGVFGGVTLTADHQIQTDQMRRDSQRFLALRDDRLFAVTSIVSRDGRAAGMQAYRRIGELLDLMRFAFDAQHAVLGSSFLLRDADKTLILDIPAIVPNPEPELPTQTLENFAAELATWSQRRNSHHEARDRVFSAFRLYRVGAEGSVFENKLVNWWTGVEYLTKGGKSGGGAVGAGVEGALTPIMLLAYVPKLLNAFRSIFQAAGIVAQTPGGPRELGALALPTLYSTLKDPANFDSIKTACEPNAYLWHNLQDFLEDIATPRKVADLVARHEKRLRWQIQRIYRARCDIVHSGRQVANASLLCANLEYYLKTALRSMIQQFRSFPTMTGPAEFFERAAYQHQRIAKQLRENSDALLVDGLR